MKRKIEVQEDVIIIGGFEIGGFFAADYCPECGHQAIIYEDYDSEFCPQCNSWLTECCGDSDCMFCKNKPDKPLPELD